MNRRNTITAILFLLLLAGGFGLLLSSFFGGEGELEGLLRSAARERDLTAVLEEAESAANSDLDRNHLFIQLYGGIQRLTGRRVVEDAVAGNTVVKLSTGALNFVDVSVNALDPELPLAHARQTADFAGQLAAEGVPFLFVVAPQKIQRGADLLPAGLEEFGNDCADAFLGELEELGLEWFDLRPLFESNGIYSGWFFTTDHHWKPEAAFFAWQNLAQVLDLAYGFPTSTSYTDPNNWTTKQLEDYFLGSQGKRVGSLYAGVDDFTIYTPKFETYLTYTSQDGGFSRAGPFQQSVCFPERIASVDWFNGNPYTYYSGGDYGLATIVNHTNPNGPRIVLLRESFSCALAPFLALSCSELTTIDLRYFEGDLLDAIWGLDADLVMTLYTASSTRLDELFAFGGTE